MAASRRPGGRSARVRQAVLDAFLDLLVEVGYAQVTFEGLAARAGVHKTTVYRRWGSREALLLDAATQTAAATVPVPDTGSLEEDLACLGTAVADNLRSTRAQAMLRAAVAEGITDPAMSEAVGAFWRTRFAAVRELVTRGAERGEVAADIEPDELTEALVGPLYLRALVTGEPIDESFVRSHARLVAAGARPRDG